MDSLVLNMYCLESGKDIGSSEEGYQSKEWSTFVLTVNNICRNQSSKTIADLPPDRIIPDQPALTDVGVDCFGPFW